MWGIYFVCFLGRLFIYGKEMHVGRMTTGLTPRNCMSSQRFNLRDITGVGFNIAM